MNAKALIPLVAGLGIGGLALKLGISALQSARAAQPSAKVKIWAARQDLPRGSQIKEEVLQAVTFPADALPAGAFKDQDKEKLVGRVPRLVAPAGLPILESMLSLPGTPAGIYVKPGFRAVAVKIDASSGVDYHLEPGCFVDVAGSFKVRREGRIETIAKMIVENVEVAAVGQRLSPAGGREGSEKEKEKERSVRAVTLFVQPEHVKRLLLAEQQGPMKLSLRGNEDQKVLDDRAVVSDRELMGDAPENKADDNETKSAALGWLRGLFDKPQPAPATPALAAAAPQPKEPFPERWILKIYRGHNEETLQFKSRDSCERVDSEEATGPGLFGPTRRSKTPTAKPERPAVKPEPTSNQPHPEPETEPEELNE